MTDQQQPGVADELAPPEAGPSLVRVGRRSDSRVLAFLSAAAVVFLAVAIAKPWGLDTPQPVPSGSTSSLAVAIPQPATVTEAQDGSPDAITWPATAPSSEALETPQSGIVFIVSDQVLVSAMGCADGVYTLVLPSAPASSDPATGLQNIEVTLECASGTPGEFQLVLPSRSAP